VSHPFRVRYPPDVSSSARARHEAAAHFAGVLGGRARYELTLVVDELVTNAIRHGAGEVELRLDLQDGSIRGEVIDDGDGFEAQVRESTPDQLGGRGLIIVSRLTQEWGVYDGSAHVWFELPLGGSAPVEAEPEVGEPHDDVLPDV
jgi:anti-sigma regulatory factor (Ser/Thr protein kinase)